MARLPGGLSSERVVRVRLDFVYRFQYLLEVTLVVVVVVDYPVRRTLSSLYTPTAFISCFYCLMESTAARIVWTGFQYVLWR